MILKILLITIICLMSACSTNWAVVEPVTLLQQKLALWEGQSAEKLQSQIGQPTEVGIDESKNEVLIYYKAITNPENKVWYCKVSYTINVEKNIISTKLISRLENAWGIYMPCVHIIQAPA